MKIYFVNDTTTQNNWGCRATTNALREMIVSAGGEIVDTMYISDMLHDLGSASGFLSEVKKVTKSVLVGNGFSKNGYLLKAGKSMARRMEALLDTAPRESQKLDVAVERFKKKKEYLKILEGIEKSDVVVINGEGSIYGSQRKGMFMFFVAYAAKVIFNKKCILVNHTADLSAPDMRDIACAVYPLMDDIVTREPVSYRGLGELFPKLDIVNGADAAYVLSPAKRESWAEFSRRSDSLSVWPDAVKGFVPDSPYVCIGGSSAYSHGAGQDYDAEMEIGKIAELLLGKKYQVFLVASDVDDERFLRPLAKNYDLPFVPAALPTQLGVDLLGNASLFISGRWHPSIFAATGGTPSLLFSANSHKVNGFREQAGLSQFPLFDALRVGEDAKRIVDLADLVMQQGDGLRRHVLSNAQKSAIRAEDNVRYLRKNF